MRIVILGAGQVGASVAESLASENNDITVVDSDQERLAQPAGSPRFADGQSAMPPILGPGAMPAWKTPIC